MVKEIVEKIKKIFSEIKPIISQRKVWIPLAIIIGLILYQQISGLIAGLIMMKKMMAPPVVQVSTIEQKDITQKLFVPARVEAKYSVDVVARISGWLQKSYFQEGQKVRKGQLLFLIEPDKYSINVQKARASVSQIQANLKKAEKDLIRAKELVKNDFVSKAYYDEIVANRDSLRSELSVNKAMLADASRNYSYTRIVSPCDGKIGKIFITQGNYVTPQAGSIAKIVSTNPIYVTFNVKSQEYLMFRKSETKKIDNLDNMVVELKLSDGSIYPLKGKVEFIDNVVDPSAGTIKLRATFENLDDFLVAGDYLNVEVYSKKPTRVILVPQDSVQDSSDGFYILCLDKDGIVQQKFIKTDGEYQGNWIVVDGLNVGDQYISKGLQKVKIGKKAVIASVKKSKLEQIREEKLIKNKIKKLITKIKSKINKEK